MSKFFKALEQAQRDRQARSNASAPAASPAPAPPIGQAPNLLTPAQLLKARELFQRDCEARTDGTPAPAESLAPAPPAVVAPLEIPPGVDEHLVSLLTPAAFEAEQYRSLRHTVEQLHKSAGLQIIAVTSAAVGDGKTTTAINLAGALAQASEARILLVDADLRRPGLGPFLGLGGASRPGLVHAIADPTLGLTQIIQDCPPFNLSLICAGQSPPSPYELLMSPRLGTLLDEARGRFDYVIVDCPPLVSVQDCRVIGRWVDGFLVVVQAHRTLRRLVEEAFNVVDPAKMIGLVFNGDDHVLSDYYSGNYSAYFNAPEAGTNGHGMGSWQRAVKKLGATLRAGANGHGAGPWQRAVENVKKMGATLRSGRRRR